MGYLIHTLDPQTWMIEEEGECPVYMYLLAGNREAVLLDTGMGTIPLGRIVAALTDLPVSVLCTHGHFDHIGGNGYFSRILVHEADRALYLAHRDDLREFCPEAIAPASTAEPEWFDGNITLDLGGRTLEILCTLGHTRGSVAILDAERRWLFTGDTCCEGAVLLHFDHSAGLEDYHRSIASLLALESRYDTTWPSHHAWPVGKETLRQFLNGCDLLLSGEAQPNCPDGKTHIFPYGDIEIIY